VTELGVKKVSGLQTITITRLIYKRRTRTLIRRQTNIYTSDTFAMYEVPENWKTEYTPEAIYRRSKPMASSDYTTATARNDYWMTAVILPRSWRFKAGG
jgi:hypothetical protein